MTFVTGGDEISLSYSGENNAGDLDNDVIRDAVKLIRSPSPRPTRSWRTALKGSDGVPDAAVMFDLTKL